MRCERSSRDAAEMHAAALADQAALLEAPPTPSGATDAAEADAAALRAGTAGELDGGAAPAAAPSRRAR